GDARERREGRGRRARPRRREKFPTRGRRRSRAGESRGEAARALRSRVAAEDRLVRRLALAGSLRRWSRAGGRGHDERVATRRGATADRRRRERAPPPGSGGPP